MSVQWRNLSLFLLALNCVGPLRTQGFTVADTVCYDGMGCFSASGPFSGGTRFLSRVPSSPDSIRTNFVLYTKDQRTKGVILDARKPSDVKSTWTSYEKRPTKVIIHGYLDDYTVTTWMTDMKDELLTHGDYNVIIVDWHHGNLFPYTQATANTRVVGAQIAILIEQLQADFQSSLGDFHLLGHSLGAHICGYAGERLLGLGRITGLDPAGPFFEGMDKVVRLDNTDALFVDNIHSDGAMGTDQPMGHLDFYPNLGDSQPGCSINPISNIFEWGLIKGSTETVACDHHRAIHYFTESINSKCPFTAFPCASGTDFKANKCHSCPKGGCASLGLAADQRKPAHGTFLKYYLETNSQSPFCQYHMDVNIKMARTANSRQERGTIKLQIHSEISSDWIQLDDSPQMFVPGNTYGWSVGVPKNVKGNITTVEFQWHHVSSTSDPSSWNPLGLRTPKLFIDVIDVISEEHSREDKFCPKGVTAENNKSLFVFTRCDG